MSAASTIDGASESDGLALLLRCCGAHSWAERVLSRRPFGSDAALFAAADAVWAEASRDDVLEALSHHPRICDSMDELRKKYASTAGWAAGEQAGARAASEQTLTALRDGNREYEARFGHIFVVCATGKTASEMLALLRARMSNAPDEELKIAAAEQAKITRLRLERLGLEKLA